MCLLLETAQGSPDMRFQNQSGTEWQGGSGRNRVLGGGRSTEFSQVLHTHNTHATTWGDLKHSVWGEKK